MRKDPAYKAARAARIAARDDRRKQLQAEMTALQEPMDRASRAVIEEAYRKYRKELEAVEEAVKNERTVLGPEWATYNKATRAFVRDQQLTGVIYMKTTAYQRDYAPLYAEWKKRFDEDNALWDEMMHSGEYLR